MSSRKVKVNGVLTKFSFDKNKKYKYDNTGNLVEATTVNDNDIVIPGSKSSLRRIGELERNVSILATRLTTTDGDSTAASEYSASSYFSDDVYFANDVRFRQGFSVDSGKTVDFNSNRLTEVGTPSSSTDAATKGYVDTAVTNGLNSKDPVITLAGDASGSVTLTNLGSGTLTVTIADDSHNHVISNVDGLQAALDSKATPADISTAISNLVNGASSAFDTLKEIQDAMATDAELSAAISGLTIGNGTLTVSAGSGLSGSGTFSANATGNSTITISHADTSSAANLAASGRRYVTGLTFDAYGHVTGYTTGTETVVNTDTNTTYSAGNGLSLSGTTFAMSGSFTGNFTATGDITAYSDDRLKTNVKTIDGALEKVSKVRGVTFERIEDGSVSTGVVAQELAAVLPEAVKTDENGMHHVAYGNITGLLIEAVKELTAQVEELKSLHRI